MRGGIAFSAQVVKDSVTMEDIVSRYLPEATRNHKGLLKIG